jgi:hypothetical protein
MVGKGKYESDEESSSDDEASVSSDGDFESESLDAAAAKPRLSLTKKTNIDEDKGYETDAEDPEPPPPIKKKNKSFKEFAGNLLSGGVKLVKSASEKSIKYGGSAAKKGYDIAQKNKITKYAADKLKEIDVNKIRDDAFKTVKAGIAGGKNLT